MSISDKCDKFCEMYSGILPCFVYAAARACAYSMRRMRGQQLFRPGIRAIIAKNDHIDASTRDVLLCREASDVRKRIMPRLPENGGRGNRKCSLCIEMNGDKNGRYVDNHYRKAVYSA